MRGPGAVHDRFPCCLSLNWIVSPEPGHIMIHNPAHWGAEPGGRRKTDIWEGGESDILRAGRGLDHGPGTPPWSTVGPGTGHGGTPGPMVRGPGAGGVRVRGRGRTGGCPWCGSPNLGHPPPCGARTRPPHRRSETIRSAGTARTAPPGRPPAAAGSLPSLRHQRPVKGRSGQPLVELQPVEIQAGRTPTECQILIDPGPCLRSPYAAFASSRLRSASSSITEHAFAPIS